jgi:hypothetical protein
VQRVLVWLVLPAVGLAAVMRDAFVCQQPLPSALMARLLLHVAHDALQCQAACNLYQLECCLWCCPRLKGVGGIDRTAIRQLATRHHSMIGSTAVTTLTLQLLQRHR